MSKADREPLRPVLRRPGLATLAWLAPLAAIALAGLLVYRSLPTGGLPLELLTDNAAGIEADVTPIRYRGVKVGLVRRVELDDTGERVRIHAELWEKASPMARQETRFWAVRPEISFSGVRGLDTLVSGPYLAMEPGEGEPRSEFELLDAPPARVPEDSLALTLLLDRTGSIDVGTRIYYRGLSIGEVVEAGLAADGRKVELTAAVERRHAHLVRDNSVFWTLSALDLDVQLFRARVTLDAMKGVFSGGLGLATPDPPGSRVGEGTRFPVQRERDDDWLEWAPDLGPADSGSPSKEDSTGEPP